MKNTLNKSYIIETINGCNNIISYILNTNSIIFKTDTKSIISKDKKLIQYLLEYFKNIRNKFESKL